MAQRTDNRKFPQICCILYIDQLSCARSIAPKTNSTLILSIFFKQADGSLLLHKLFRIAEYECLGIMTL